MNVVPDKLRRILVFGGSGSGKTTFSIKLSILLNIKAYHMDDIFWLENWQRLSDNDLREAVRLIVQQDSWILDGNYTRTQDLSLPRATLVIILHFHPLITVWRLVKRTISRNTRFQLGTHTDLPKNISSAGEGHIIEAVKELSKYSIQFYYNKFPRLQERLDGVPTLVLHSPSQLTAFLQSLSESMKPKKTTD
ncbi:MAG: hypothetical protein INQ03_01295 [Candidatus Heimdallarchaeota archaeon]|nr:hypothetical protein [Candidatus Heimdallarchaeota archaeon]